MRKMFWGSIALLAVAVFVYYSMAQKVYRIEQARMWDKYQKKEISKTEFDVFIASYTLMDVLKNPKALRSFR
jgi:hypothetical protein